jgi:hypothetical protein
LDTNLKNFPKTAEGENRDDADLWAEHLEKELREWQRRIANYPVSSDYDAGQSSVIRQLLGE